MASENSKVIVISECFVRPKYEVKESKKPYYLVGIDLTMLSLRYIQTCFMYNKPTTNDFKITSFVEKMKDSLSHTLVHYYPLAGCFTTVKYEDEHACSIHIDCNKGPGARVVHASCANVSMFDLVDHLSEVRFSFNFGDTTIVNYDGHTEPLVSLQVTELKDGIVVGIAMNHAVADGTAFMNFVHSLCEIFRSENIDKKDITLSQPPIFNQYIPEGCDLIQKLPYLEPDEFIYRQQNDPRLHETLYRFSSSSISKLKERAKSELGPGFEKISSFQALAALMWISLNRARKLPPQSMSICIMAIDCRSRYAPPPLPPNHFGNHGQVVMVTKNVGELLEDGLGSAAAELHKGIAAYDHQASTGYLTALMEEPQVLRLDEIDKNPYVDNFVNFSWASRFDTMGVEFGLGRPVAFQSGNNDRKEGAVNVKMGIEGKGSIDLEVSLSLERRIALESDKEFMAYVS